MTSSSDSPNPGAIGELLEAALRRSTFSAASWAFGDESGTVESGALGTPDPARHPCSVASTGTLFDLASLTKIVAVWPAIGLLSCRGELDLDAPIAEYLPIEPRALLGTVTTRQLLTHSSGLRKESAFEECGETPREICASILSTEPQFEPGSRVQYGDRAPFMLGLLVESISGARLDEFVQHEVWNPLGLTATAFAPIRGVASIASTTRPDATVPVSPGNVHDPSARLYRLPNGIAGVFSSVDDVAGFLSALSHARSGRGSVFQWQWLEQSFQVQTRNLVPSRGLSWHPSPPTDATSSIWSHNGFTGTALWFEPVTGQWATLLTNRVYSDPEPTSIATVRDRFRRSVFGA